MVSGLATMPALRKLTACLVQDAREYQPASRVRERVQTRKSVTESAGEEGSDDRGNDRFAWRPVELEFHAGLSGRAPAVEGPRALIGVNEARAVKILRACVPALH